MKVKKVRDLTLIEITCNKTMVIACDSCGGIGMKEQDSFKVPTNYVARFTARVAILEVLCTGAEVVTISNAVCNEMDPTGHQTIIGIKEELKLAGIDHIALTGSTEENFVTNATGIGITAIGICDNNKLRVNNIKQGAVIISMGIPKVGDEIQLQGDKTIVNYDDIYSVLQEPLVYEIIPVGSKGIIYETLEAARNNNLQIKLSENIAIDINKSAGPATAIIVAIHPSLLDKYINLDNINLIGTLY